MVSAFYNQSLDYGNTLFILYLHISSCVIFQTTSYANIDANEILYADFPSVQIQATSDYQHIVDGKCVAKMIKGKSYYLIKQVNEWWEITDGQHSSSFFVKCEYGQMKDPATELRMKPKQSLRKTTIDIHSKRDSCKHESRQSRSSYKEEKVSFLQLKSLYHLI